MIGRKVINYTHTHTPSTGNEAGKFVKPNACAHTYTRGHEEHLLEAIAFETECTSAKCILMIDRIDEWRRQRILCAGNLGHDHVVVVVVVVERNAQCAHCCRTQRETHSGCAVHLTMLLIPPRRWPTQLSMSSCDTSR